MKNVNWNDVQDDVRRPVPGGYAARITKVTDVEDKEYLLIEWDFADGPMKGANKETFDAFGYWPMAFVQSYKDSALRFFKGFKTAVEQSTPGFVFDCGNPHGLVGKFVGVVLGEEEYYSTKHGDVRKRLVVVEKRSGKAIREGDYKVPELKKLDSAKIPSGSYAAVTPEMPELNDEDDDLPF